MSEDQKTPIAATDEEVDQLLEDQLKATEDADRALYDQKTPEQIDAEEAAAARAKAAEKEAKREAAREGYRAQLRAQSVEAMKQIQAQIDATSFDDLADQQLARLSDVGETVKIMAHQVGVLSIVMNAKIGILLGQVISMVPKDEQKEKLQQIKELMVVVDEEALKLADRD